MSVRITLIILYNALAVMALTRCTFPSRSFGRPRKCHYEQSHRRDLRRPLNGLACGSRAVTRFDLI